MLLSSLLVLTTYALKASSLFHKANLDIHNYYALHHDPTSDVPLHEIAALLDIQIVEPIGSLENHWLARANASVNALGVQNNDTDRVIETHEKLYCDTLLSARRDISSAVRHLSRLTPVPFVRRAPPGVKRGSIAFRDDSEARKRLNIADPYFTQQWSIFNRHSPENTLNVIRVWDELKITGQGVTVSVIDDGINWRHEDLIGNFDAESSADFLDNKESPIPEYIERDNHGTHAAGVIASAKNHLCGVGIAYNAKIAGVRLFNDDVVARSDQTATAFTFKNQKVDIYSCSFGTLDDGRSLAYPNYIVEQAMIEGVNDGRGTKGNIFVFGAGNGGLDGDNCSFDEYANSIYTITMGALDHTGKHGPFSESCASVMVVVHAGNWDKGILTVDSDNENDRTCTDEFKGTSSATPAGAGVFALALEAQPALTWRDIQYLCVETAKRVDPDSDSWEITSIPKRPYSYKYGFGALDAYALVNAAQTWKPVNPQTWIEMKPVQLKRGKMDKNGKFSGGTSLSKDGVAEKVVVTQKMVAAADFDTIEHVQVKVWAEHSRRGDIEVEIVSPGPKNIVSLLAMKRPNDDDTTGLQGWTFTTLKHWGEKPEGTWEVRFKDQGNKKFKGKAIGFSVTFWGCATKNTKRSLYARPSDDRNVFPPTVN